MFASTAAESYQNHLPERNDTAGPDARPRGLWRRKDAADDRLQRLCRVGEGPTPRDRRSVPGEHAQGLCVSVLSGLAQFIWPLSERNLLFGIVLHDVRPGPPGHCGKSKGTTSDLHIWGRGGGAPCG